MAPMPVRSELTESGRRSLARIVTALFTVAGLINVYFGWRLAAGQVGPNATTGFRTSSTLANPDLWYAVNAVTGRAMTWLGAALIVMALVLHVTVATRRPALVAVILAACLVVGIAVTCAGVALVTWQRRTPVPEIET
jgi:hypothetical protein